MADTQRPSSVRERATSAVDDPITVVDDGAGDTARPALHRISWLAAFTIGLASTDRDDRLCVSQLLDTDASACELRGAHGMLAGWDPIDAERHRRAQRILERALARTKEDDRAPRWSSPREHRWVTEWGR